MCIIYILVFSDHIKSLKLSVKKLNILCDGIWVFKLIKHQHNNLENHTNLEVKSSAGNNLLFFMVKLIHIIAVPGYTELQLCFFCCYYFQNYPAVFSSCEFLYLCQMQANLYVELEVGEHYYRENSCFSIHRYYGVRPINK